MAPPPSLAQNHWRVYEPGCKEMMQIYLPFSDFKINIKMLDEVTLGRQCNVATAFLEDIKKNKEQPKWQPGLAMWITHDTFLGFYAHRLFAEWKVLGYPDLWSSKVTALGYLKLSQQPRKPWWWGHARFHESNKATLLRLDPQWYGRFLKNVDMADVPWWPRPQPNKWIRGPKQNDGPFLISGKPVFNSVDAMNDQDFIAHANLFHSLTPDMPNGIRDNESPQLLTLLKTLHDRFHVQRVYTSHDHR
jgi:hypothetical protein